MVATVYLDELNEFTHFSTPTLPIIINFGDLLQSNISFVEPNKKADYETESFGFLFETRPRRDSRDETKIFHNRSRNRVFETRPHACFKLTNSVYRDVLSHLRPVEWSHSSGTIWSPVHWYGQRAEDWRPWKILVSSRESRLCLASNRKPNDSVS